MPFFLLGVWLLHAASPSYSTGLSVSFSISRGTARSFFSGGFAELAGSGHRLCDEPRHLDKGHSSLAHGLTYHRYGWILSISMAHPLPRSSFRRRTNSEDAFGVAAMTIRP